mmetsp:Transcript_82663/g.145866  ORF Transcript_82663/g.145866 Transcript_82663/m.145866 type:complete len:147 (-) Transcript_82663:75-515(-)
MSLTSKADESKMSLRLLKLDGSVIAEVQATRTWKVVDVKKQVTRRDGTPWKEQKLFLGEQELAPDTEVLDSLLPADATFDLSLVITPNLQGAWSVLAMEKLEKEATAVAEAVKHQQEAKMNWSSFARRELQQAALAEAAERKAHET